MTKEGKGSSSVRQASKKVPPQGCVVARDHKTVSNMGRPAPEKTVTIWGHWQTSGCGFLEDPNVPSNFSTSLKKKKKKKKKKKGTIYGRFSAFWLRSKCSMCRTTWRSRPSCADAGASRKYALAHCARVQTKFWGGPITSQGSCGHNAVSWLKVPKIED